LYGGRLNVPCRYLEDLVGKKVFKSLLNRSGLNCRVIIGGAIRKGDGIEWCDSTSLDPALRRSNESMPLERPPEAWPDA
jgi:MOSC domain-containing protein YiiM